MWRGWGPWSEAASYAICLGPLFIERYFDGRVEDGGGVRSEVGPCPGPWLDIHVRRRVYGAREGVRCLAIIEKDGDIVLEERKWWLGGWKHAEVLGCGADDGREMIGG